jgi:hypothetical protein
MYQLCGKPLAETHILRLADQVTIPKDSDNRDYAAYLEWVEAGNTPLPADEA